MFGGGQAPSPAQVALAKQFARANLRSFFVAIGLLRATPFAWNYVFSLFK